MRDRRKLMAFKLADQLAYAVYRQTRGMPPEEKFGLTLQLCNPVVLVASSIVEGCARHTESDYLRSLDMAYGSVRELECQISHAGGLGYLDHEEPKALVPLAAETREALGGLIRALRGKGQKAKGKGQGRAQ
ncbi:MAG: four helix bundle protein [Polyangiaceae bacterium]|nr:four helix bundle protein [Polyangiaceae bacterium]